MSEESEQTGYQWFTIKEAATYLNIGEQTLYRWMRDGRITFRKVGDSTRFLQEDLDAMIDVHLSEKEITKAKQACPICQHDELIDGTVQSTGKVLFRPKKTKFWTWREGNVPIESRMCSRCGATLLFGDVKKLDALRQDGPKGD